MSKRAPHEQAQRRLNVAHIEMWEILRAASGNKDYTRTFQSHAAANAFMHKYYRFRMDCREVNWPNSVYLNGMRCTGVCADGTLFDSKNRASAVPITVTWINENTMMEKLTQSAEQLSLEAAEVGSKFSQRGTPDSTEAVLAKYFTGGTPAIHAGEGHQAPAVAGGPGRVIPECIHEWDTTETFCLHCRIPKE